MSGSWLGRKLSMMAFLRSSPRFSVLVRALELTELSPSLEVKPCFGNWEYEKSLFQAGAGGPFTLFAPTNSAFDLVVTITLSSIMWLTQWSWNYYKVGREAMLGDVPSLRKALLRHIVRLTENMIIRASVTFSWHPLLILIVLFLEKNFPPSPSLLEWVRWTQPAGRRQLLRYSNITIIRTQSASQKSHNHDNCPSRLCQT